MRQSSLSISRSDLTNETSRIVEKFSTEHLTDGWNNISINDIEWATIRDEAMDFAKSEILEIFRIRYSILIVNIA